MAQEADARRIQTEETVRRILASAKYRELDEAFVRRIAEEALARFGTQKQALNYAKRKLHQAFGAYVSGAPSRAVIACIEAISRGAVDGRAACRAAMRAHASTAERVQYLDPLYRQVAAWCGPVGSVADLACGLNPLAIPWMGLAPGAAYWCCEVDRDLVAALARLGEVFPVEVTSRTCDLVASPPALRADVALLLKTMPTLEQQRAGAANRVLAALDCRHVVVSLPRRSLSGRRAYADDPLAIIGRAVAGTRYRLQGEATFGGEVLYHLDTAEAVPPAAARRRRGRGQGGAPADAGQGLLLLVGTPIGNLGDLGWRARAVLRDADVVCAEDTRRTRELLSAFDLHPPLLVSVRSHNEERQAARVVRWLGEGRRVAVVTDAGMPGVSDPGQRLVRAVVDAGGRVSVVPGPDAATSALLISGLPRDRWSFEGFLPTRGTPRASRLTAVAEEPRSTVLFEAPHRIVRTLTDLEGALGGDRVVVVANDLTKRFERVWRGPVRTVAAELRATEPRGEFVIVVAPAALGLPS